MEKKNPYLGWKLQPIVLQLKKICICTLSKKCQMWKTNKNRSKISLCNLFSIHIGGRHNC